MLYHGLLERKISTCSQRQTPATLLPIQARAATSAGTQPPLRSRRTKAQALHPPLFPCVLMSTCQSKWMLKVFPPDLQLQHHTRWRQLNPFMLGICWLLVVGQCGHLYFKVLHGLLQICPDLWLQPSLVCYRMVIHSYVSWEGLSFLSVEAKKREAWCCLFKKKTHRMERIESEQELGRACWSRLRNGPGCKHNKHGGRIHRRWTCVVV